jgi:hypothetical protein
MVVAASIHGIYKKRRAWGEGEGAMKLLNKKPEKKIPTGCPEIKYTAICSNF